MSKIAGIYDFIRSLIALFPESFRETKEEIWAETAVRVLYNPRVDYDKLFGLVVCQNPSGNFAPSFPWILEKSKECYKKDEVQKSQWRQVRVFNPIYNKVQNTDCFPAGTSDQAVCEYYEKRFKCKGWQVVE